MKNKNNITLTLLIFFGLVPLCNLFFENNSVFGYENTINVKKNQQTKSQVGIHFTEKEIINGKESEINELIAKDNSKGGEEFGNGSSNAYLPQSGESLDSFEIYGTFLCVIILIFCFCRKITNIERRRINGEKLFSMVDVRQFFSSRNRIN
ncbi:MAG: hypothetical protein RR545_06905 [Carnobacterium sp.]|uniref:hypothetical protein n=1 Tax=Carnobacterium sp. TaxID=48221 RepID=UPI002FC63153